MSAQQTGKGREKDMVEKKSQRFELSNLVRFGYMPSPAEIIRDELDARGWSLADFAGYLGWSLDAVMIFLNDESSITGETALKLGDIFGTSTDFWQTLDDQYQGWKKDRSNSK